MGDARVVRTERVQAHSQSPLYWNEHFQLVVAYPVDQVKFALVDTHISKTELAAFVPASRIATGELIDEWFPVVGRHGPHTAIRLQIKFTPCDENPVYQNGISEDYALGQSYFPMRHGGNLKLYQDAHVVDGMLPEIRLEDGRNFEHQKCWEDICHLIMEARHLVYITGWSIFHQVRLVRESTRPLPIPGDFNLGELLKHKAQQGVRVVLLIWDDKTSNDMFFFKTPGMMQTHDEETRKFFKHSSVTCVLAPRYKLTNFIPQVGRIFYTQHQKSVIVDTKGISENSRKITAFIGGLDLCDGRYDTPTHRLYSDLDTVFKDDYHNPSFDKKQTGPRQPWHDLHCQIEGPAAYDVLKNFEQRWDSVTECSNLTKLYERVFGRHDYDLVNIENISEINSPSKSIPTDHPSLWVSDEDDAEKWHIQVFRSVDSNSAEGFPQDFHTAQEQNLVYEKNLVIDKSIQMAYIEAIRSAQRFIFIENQYFIGASFAWPDYEKAGAHNLIPMELALKVVSKIRAKERFTVYIIIPMWPEGVPKSSSVQEILYWQGQTMKLMYGIIAKELKSANLENAHPCDYLNFYCLGNREENDREQLPSDSASQRHGRFMIYVHSKGMIVDDDYIIIGSANINERSMAGSRDTEIAMGGYQPHHTWAKKKGHPHGQVYGYRLSLWAEHMGEVNNLFNYPESLECVKYVNNIAEENWNKYVAEDYSQLQGHLIKYPLQIDYSGDVKPLPGYESFPDFIGDVMGSKTSLPVATTT
ncbi:hypothetical protein ABFX02_14G220100 [Erythranthe guttata]|nr:PREDICTED: phospholipase D delta-like [Erythranthe guttata]|eukprot:XP_012850807.1 PREDICTED: phospholipase D delta-like [Erythranthe guttata]